MCEIAKASRYALPFLKNIDIMLGCEAVNNDTPANNQSMEEADAILKGVQMGIETEKALKALPAPRCPIPYFNTTLQRVVHP